MYVHRIFYEFPPTKVYIYIYVYIDMKSWVCIEKFFPLACSSNNCIIFTKFSIPLYVEKAQRLYSIAPAPA